MQIYRVAVIRTNFARKNSIYRLQIKSDYMKDKSNIDVIKYG